MSRPPPAALPARAPRLGVGVAEALAARIRAAELAPGSQLPTEAAIMQSFGVSRTVVREAIAKLQAAGLVRTRHGIGTFVREAGQPLALPVTLDAASVLDTVAVLELRLGLEAEAAALASLRRSAHDVSQLRACLEVFEQAMEGGGDTVAPDRRLHQLIADATRNQHFSLLTQSLGQALIPRARLDTPALEAQGRLHYLRRVHAEHESIVNAIANADPEAARAAMRTHLSNSRDRLRQALA